jgi:hypothetical protein
MSEMIFNPPVPELDVSNLERLAAVNHPLFRPPTRNGYRAGDKINVELLVQNPDGCLLRFAPDNS